MNKNSLIINDDSFAEYVQRLTEYDDDIFRKIISIAKGHTTSEVLVIADIKKMKKYNKFLDGRKNGVMRLTINSNTLRHMFNRGHLTGVAKKGEDDKTPLDISDWSRIKDVFINPNKVKINKNKLQIDKWYDDKHLRLITSKSKGMRKNAIVTFFDFVDNKKE